MTRLFLAPAAASALALAAMFAAPPGAAQSVQDVVSMDIMPGWRTEAGDHMAGLRIRLAPGWKTYWRVPGESGIPPQFDFSASRNVDSVAVMWPRPEVFSTFGIETIGYADEVVLPLQLAARDAGAAMIVSAHAAIGVCQDVCLPVEIRVSGELAPGAGLHDALIAQAVDLVPRPLRDARATCAIDPIADGLRLKASLSVPSQGPGERVFVEPDRADIWVSPADVARKGGTVDATMDLVPPEGRPFALDRGGLRFTVLGQDSAVEVQGCQAE